MRRRLLVAILLAVVSITGARPIAADPCGMVPPIYQGEQTPIARVGLQQTYVFYKDGVETFVIRPGFTGKVDEFGMLIPFPTPPAIRKVPNHIFPHIAAAVDPPEVVVDLTPRLVPSVVFNAPAPNAAPGLELDEEWGVRVLRKEAVGMYEVAVLEAGSAKALKKWMDEHGYKYPDGMDKPCNDYVAQGWCFVAIKTKVGQKNGADPKPGQRRVNTKLPDGASFDGHVQGMGFRFRVDELVVPMRLSAFNDGELRNVVYLLTDKPQKIRAIPEEYVVRQISGARLVKNLTGPLPLRIIGGTERDIPAARRKTLPLERNPQPHNGAAGELFASDLLAVTSGELSLRHEEQEKVLLRIGERFGLRGADIDKLNNDTLKAERDKTVTRALGGLKKLTLTVVDGDFPREVLAKQNLSFAAYRMPAKRNNAGVYDPKVNGPAPKQRGILKLGALEPVEETSVAATAKQTTNDRRLISLISAAVISLFGAVVILRLRRAEPGRHCGPRRSL